MKKVLQWFVLIVLIVLTAVYGLEWLMSKPYWPQLVAGAAVGLVCAALNVGLIIGAFWTFVVQRQTSRSFGPSYVAGEQTEANRLRLIRDGIRVFGGAADRSAPPVQQQPWLPPLQPFEAEFEEIEEGD